MSTTAYDRHERYFFVIAFEPYVLSNSTHISYYAVRMRKVIGSVVVVFSTKIQNSRRIYEC